MSTEATAALVQVQDVDKTFRRGSEEIHVLSGLNLEVPARRVPRADGAVRFGQIHAAQSDRRPRPRRRTARSQIGGDRIDQLSDRQLAAWRARHVGFVFQFYNLLPVLTAERNVELPLLLTHLSKAERTQARGDRA